MRTLPLKVSNETVAAFCEKWKVSELALFGSVLREDFDSDSDVDILVDFAPEADWSLFDWVDMIDELKALFGREVDLVAKEGLRNPFRRHAILTSREIIYAA
jgi:hypothetical protein